MEFLSNLSDDQIALIGCFVALVGSGGVVSLSYYLAGHSRGKRDVSQLSAASRDKGRRIARTSSDAKRTRRKAA